MRTFCRQRHHERYGRLWLFRFGNSRRRAGIFEMAFTDDGCTSVSMPETQAPCAGVQHSGEADMAPRRELRERRQLLTHSVLLTPEGVVINVLLA